MLPSDFLIRLQNLVPSPEYSTILDAFSKKRPTTFRVNILKSKQLKLDNFDLMSVPWNHHAFVLKNSKLRELTETKAYKEGYLYVQSLSSMLPPIILDPQPGERVLDIAAAPGSKTTQIVAMMENRGEIVANDTSHVRIYRLKANIMMQGVSIARVINIDGRSIWKQYPEYFDKTLVDVPCSMEGRFNTNDIKSYQDWSLKKVKELSHLQRWLLRSAISATKPGGTIVYSTCTLSPEENEDVIDWVLEKEKGNIVLEDIKLEGLKFDPALRHWGTKSYDQSIERTVRIYPTQLMEGFYIAKIRKTHSSIPKSAV